MARFASITMSMRDIDRLKVIQAVIDGHLKASTAANRLQLTKRQVNRLVQRYRADGAAGLISRQRGVRKRSCKHHPASLRMLPRHRLCQHCIRQAALPGLQRCGIRARHGPSSDAKPMTMTSGFRFMASARTGMQAKLYLGSSVLLSREECPANHRENPDMPGCGTWPCPDSDSHGVSVQPWQDLSATIRKFPENSGSRDTNSAPRVAMDDGMLRPDHPVDIDLVNLDTFWEPGSYVLD